MSMNFDTLQKLCDELNSKVRCGFVVKWCCDGYKISFSHFDTNTHQFSLSITDLNVYEENTVTVNMWLSDSPKQHIDLSFYEVQISNVVTWINNLLGWGETLLNNSTLDCVDIMKLSHKLDEV